MRLAHLADLHLGYRQYHRLNPAGINQREADVARAFRSAIDGVIAAKADIVVIAGDVFHAVRPTNQAIIFGFRELQRLREALPRVPIVMIAGNHDTPRATETGSILRLFQELGVDVVTDQAEWLEYDELGIDVLAAPHQAVVAEERPNLRRRNRVPHEVLVAHGEVEGLFPLDRWWVEPGGALLDSRELEQGRWSYVALGHYHVQREVRPGIWYAGSLDFVTSNPWGELVEQRKVGVKSKGWLLVDLESGTVTRQPIEAPRDVVDLKPISAQSLSAAELDAEIAGRLKAVRKGIDDKVVRLVVYDCPRAMVRDLDHAAIRSAKAAALHLHLDFRRPEIHRIVGVAAPGRKTLPEVLREYLTGRPLPERVPRERFVSEGVALLEGVTQDPDRTD
ncbi:MAG: DNA repair exonuclease [Gemmatimonadales bacterium]